MPSPRSHLNRAQLKAKKELGQNFLEDPSTSEMILTRAGVAAHHTLIEIGPGLGAMTLPAARMANALIAIEKDRDLIPVLEGIVRDAQLTNVSILNRDILHTDLTSCYPDNADDIMVIGNLPYNISTQVLIRLLTQRHRVSSCVFMFQKELARRIAALPGSGDYSRLSVMTQYCATVKRIAEVKAHLFFPRPKVDSTVIQILFHPVLPCPAHDEVLLGQVVQAAFNKRRKTLKNALSNSDLAQSASTVEAALESAQIDPVRRAETLSVSEFVRLANHLHALRTV
ncbi:MAG: ribosomal RNA small subunit methyltransferase A [Deltaproteobacteria bacterium]|nr:MAG: ribosomal RNA small subunit methyltransferase A [Deltaproteobacteria bacterium]